MSVIKRLPPAPCPREWRRFLLRWLQWRRLTGVIEIAVSVAAAYMSYYITQVCSPAHSPIANSG